MLACLSLGSHLQASPLEDSVRVWLAEGEKAKWLQMMSHLQQDKMTDLHQQALSLPHPLGLAALPRAERPKWAQVPDATLWDWYRRSQAVIFFRNKLQSAELTSAKALSPKERLDQLRKEEMWPWQLGNIVLWGVVLLLALAFVVSRRQTAALPPASRRWRDLHLAFLHQKWSENTRLKWAQFKIQSDDKPPSEDLPCFAHLTHSERELVQYITQDISNETASTMMSCSVSYIYNLRSSIRQKLGLSGDRNLNFEIRRIVRDQEQRNKSTTP